MFCHSALDAESTKNYKNKQIPAFAGMTKPKVISSKQKSILK
jgi:hypothetical protein